MTAVCQGHLQQRGHRPLWEGDRQGDADRLCGWWPQGCHFILIVVNITMIMIRKLFVSIFFSSLGHLISLKCPGTQGQQRMSAWHPDCEIPWRSQRRNRAGHDCHSGPVVQCTQTRDQPPSEFRATLVFLTWILFNWHSVCWTTLPIIFCTKKKRREQIIHELTILNFYWQNCWF